MPYTMVPVPEEFVIEIMQTIIRLGLRAQMDTWDDEAVAQLFQETDESGRAVLSTVARGTLARSEIPDTAVAEAIEIGVREVHGIMREINEWAQASNRPNLITLRKNSETLRNGRVREQRVLFMPRDMAEVVRMIEKAELENAPHPLTERVI